MAASSPSSGTTRERAKSLRAGLRFASKVPLGEDVITAGDRRGHSAIMRHQHCQSLRRFCQGARCRERPGLGGSEFMDTAHTLVVPASADGLRQAEEGLDDFSAAHGLTRNDTWPFHVAIDEILSNIVKYGLAGERARSEVQIFLLLEEESLEMVILDDAAPFNPLDAARPETGLAAEDREIGGLGIEIVRRLMDSIDYERLDDQHNRLTLRRRLGL